MNLTAQAIELLSFNNLNYALLISTRHRFIYIDNPKTGCSTLKAGLIELELTGTENEDKIREICDEGIRIHQRDIIPFQQLKEFSHLADPLTYFMEQNYFIFSFVRNPYTRLVSGYFNKIGQNKPQKLMLLNKFGINDIEYNLSFSDFIKFNCQLNDNELDAHWGIQSKRILYSLVPHQFIGRFEHYSEDYYTLFKKLNCTPPTLRHRNKRVSDITQKPHELITPELQALIYQKYRVDFDNFNYTYDLPEIL
jgi:hypothetical protein